MAKFLIYLLVGVVLSCYWWNKTNKKENESEDGMAVIYLTFKSIFWPIFLVSNLYYHKHI